MNRRLWGACWVLALAGGCAEIAGLNDFSSADPYGDGTGGEGGAASGGNGTGALGGGGNGSSAGGSSSGGSVNTGGTEMGGAGTGGVSTGGASTGGSGTGGAAGACATNHGGCDENADCTDNGSGAVCTCQPAYLGDGASCALRTERVGVAAYEPVANAFTGSPVVSRDGRFVAFSSTDATLVPDDTNARADVFVRNLLTGAVERVSVSDTEAQANQASRYPAISGDGRYVVFSSLATNLVPLDTNAVEDVFIRDRTLGTTTRVSVASNGAQGNEAALMADVSDNGRYVAFASAASNLVTGDTNGSIDIFLRDVTGSTTTRESVRSDETQDFGDSTRPAISADGTRIVFESMATMGFADAGGAADIFVRDRTAGTTTRVSVSTSGTQANGVNGQPDISGDGTCVAFGSQSTNLALGDTGDDWDVFVHVLSTGETTRVSVSFTGTEGDGQHTAPSLSTTGRYVAFGSSSTNLVAGDTNANRDVFVFDRQTNTTSRVSVSALNVQGDGASRYPSISGDGGVVAFDSAATNLVSGDTNALVDLFIRRRQ